MNLNLNLIHRNSKIKLLSFVGILKFLIFYSCRAKEANPPDNRQTHRLCSLCPLRLWFSSKDFRQKSVQLPSLVPALNVESEGLHQPHLEEESQSGFVVYYQQPRLDRSGWLIWILIWIFSGLASLSF